MTIHDLIQLAQATKPDIDTLRERMLTADIKFAEDRKLAAPNQTFLNKIYSL